MPRLDENKRYTVAAGTSESVADRLDRRGSVATFEEQTSGCIDDRGPGETGPGLTAVAFPRRHVLTLTLSK